MYKYFIFIIILVSSTVILPKNKNEKVILYYFHPNIRCESCTQMEKQTRRLLNNSFKNELKSKSLEFKVLNIEKYENTKYENKYQLYMPSLVLSKISDQKEIKYEILDKVWNLEGVSVINKYLEFEIRKF